MSKLAIYVHFPFCIRRCLYCDFNTFAGMERYVPQYLVALGKEVKLYAKEAVDHEVTSIYFGGGTPSLFRPRDLKDLLFSMKREFLISPQAEITLETNPGTVDQEYLADALNSGINRLSLGIQSLNETELKLLGRIHSAEQAIRAFQDARRAGFSNISIDLIYGLPGQQVYDFQESLQKIVELAPDHISLYALTLDDHVPMAELIKRGRLPAIDDDLAADMYEMATGLLDNAGYYQYEISNWAIISQKQDFRSVHNLQYWRNLPYLGLGAGAHGSYKNYRTENEGVISKFIELVSQSQKVRYPDFPQISHRSEISKWEEAQETMMLGLRLTEEGVDLQQYAERYHFNPLEIFHPQIKGLEKQGLLEFVIHNGKRIRLTRKARLLGNFVFKEFVDNPKPAAMNF